MNTSKPVSTISFNTTGFLDEKLSEMLKAGKIEFWAYVHHFPEPKDDDGNGKEHNHVYILPASRQQTEGFRSSLKEIDPSNLSNKPLGCLPFMTTKYFGDWYLYALHDAQYLKYKGLERKFHYKPDDVKTSDRDALNWYVRQIDLAEVTPIQGMIDAIGMGMTFEQYFMLGKIPVQQLKPFKEAWYIACRQLELQKIHKELEDKKNKGQSEVSDKKGKSQSKTSDKPHQVDFNELPW